MASVKQRECEMMFSLNAKPGNAYSETFTKTQSQINAMQREINNLSKTQSEIS